MTKEKHNCDNVNCNHNNTKGLCCLFNPDDCKYRQLEKENAELKKKNLATQDAVTMQMYTNKANKEIADRQLTKAKEIIKDFLLMAEVEHLKDRYETVDEAEQFLKEVEK